jgi:DNA-binding IclR family transcriptional regulator
LTQISALERELETVRARGVAHDNEELEIGVRCVAAGVYDDAGRLVAGLSISAPTDRLELAWADRVKATAQDISRALGHAQIRAGR